MRYVFSAHAWEDYQYWAEADKKMMRRINSLIQEIAWNPYQGTGKPEPLKHALAGWWSRRITASDRIVYRMEGDSLHIAQLRYHY